MFTTARCENVKKQHHSQLLLKRGERNRHRGCVWRWCKIISIPSHLGRLGALLRDGRAAGEAGGVDTRAKLRGRCRIRAASRAVSQPQRGGRTWPAWSCQSVSARPLQKCCSGSLSTRAPKQPPLPLSLHRHHHPESSTSDPNEWTSSSLSLVKRSSSSSSFSSSTILVSPSASPACLHDSFTTHITTTPHLFLFCYFDVIAVSKYSTSRHAVLLC